MSENSNGAPKGPKAIIEPLLAMETSEHEDASERIAPEASDVKKGSKAVNFQTATIGFFEGVGRAAWAYADAHPHATLYGILGFVLAILILVIGLWRTLVIAVFVAVGSAIGHAVDSNKNSHGFASSTYLGRFINGGK